MSARDVRQFFDDVAEEYRDTSAGMAGHHVVTAKLIERSLSGRTLSVGGLWSRFDPTDLPPFLTVADLSVAMLSAMPATARGILADGRRLPFGSGSFDDVIFPLILHHITDGGAAAARRCVRVALAEAHRVLVAGGSVWISEFCLNRAIYAAELLLAPVTRGLLAAVDTPLVVMHSRGFFRTALEDAGFTQIEFLRIRPPQARPFDTIRPIIGLPSLKVPRFLYPVVPTLIRARASSTQEAAAPRGG